MPIVNSARGTYGPQGIFKLRTDGVGTLNISSSTALSNYQIQTTIPYSSQIRSDFADLKFFQGSTPCSYWIEEKTNGVSAKVWVKVPTINNGSTTISVRADGTTNNSNGVNTFEWYDDFSSGTYGAGKWTLSNTTNMTVTNSGLPSGVNHGSFCLRGVSNAAIVYGSSTWNGNFAVHERSYALDTSVNGFTRNGFRQGTSNDNQVTYLDHSIDTVYYRDNNWYGFDFSDLSTPVGGNLRNNWNISIVKIAGGTGTLTITDQNGRTFSHSRSATLSGWNAPFLGLRGDSSTYNQSSTIYWDWFFIRKANPTEPTVTFTGV